MQQSNIKTKALVVLSGGQDSTTCLFWAKKMYDEVYAITFDYGQRHVIEIEAAMKVANLAGVQGHEIINVPNCLIGKSFLTDHSLPVEKFESFSQMEHHNAYKENKLDSSFVPMRNALFLTIAANRASILKCDAIITGVTAADFAEYGEFSWEWLGGFIDAEGHFSEINKTSTPNLRLSISQKDPELLVRIGNWVKKQLPEIKFSTDLQNVYFGIQALRSMAPYLTPHLHSPHRRKQASRGEGLIMQEEAELTDAYVTGFWEGDGSYHAEWVKTRVARKSGKDGKTRIAKFDFFQKDPIILEKIQTYLKRGYLGQRHSQNNIYYLSVGDGPLSSKILKRFQKHFNVLGSFEKIVKWKHEVGLFAGGFNPPYPDCTPDFILATQKAINEALKQPSQSFIKIETPVMFKTKAESVLWAKNDLLGCWDALAYTHTSYDGKYPPTDNNHANVLRAKGFEDAGLPDPLVIRAVIEGLMQYPQTDNYNSYNNGANK